MFFLRAWGLLSRAARIMLRTLLLRGARVTQLHLHLQPRIEPHRGVQTIPLRCALLRRAAMALACIANASLKKSTGEPEPKSLQPKSSQDRKSTAQNPAQ